MLMIDPLE